MVNPMFRVKSVYDIPLIKLITENLKYKLCQPTSEQSKLFKVPQKYDSSEIEILDVMEGYGISLEADEEYVSEIVSLIQDTIPHVITIQHPVQLHAVYNGTVVHVNDQKNLSIVDIGENVNTILFGAQYRREQKIVVQIKSLNIFEDQLPVCSTTVHFPGQTVILERDADFVRVSRKLSKYDRDRLFELGKQLRPRDHGLIMRTSAVESSSEAIQADIDHLIQQAEELDLLISGSSYGPGILQPGHAVAHIMFVKAAKEKLGEIRNEITPTLPSYYWFMSYSPELKLTTTFAEKLSSDVDSTKLTSLLKETILERDFSENAILHLQEYCLISAPMHRVLGQLNWSKDVMVIERSFRSSRGEHFALDEGIHQGDSAVVLTKEGSWSIHTKIFRKELLVGETVKIVTPVELYGGGKLRYIDLGLLTVKKNDVVEPMDSGTVNNLVEQGFISKEFGNKVLSFFEQSQEELKTNKEHIIILPK